MVNDQLHKANLAYQVMCVVEKLCQCLLSRGTVETYQPANEQTELSFGGFFNLLSRVDAAHLQQRVEVL